VTLFGKPDAPWLPPGQVVYGGSQTSHGTGSSACSMKTPDEDSPMVYSGRWKRATGEIWWPR
jgi:hypothetical protein